MEGELFQGLYRLIQQVDKLHAQPKGVHFSDARIVEVLLWAVLHDRPTCWACQRRHWPAHRRCHPLPTPATMSRRLRTCSVLFFLAAMEAALQAAAPRGLVQSVDAMPLPVGGWSKDRDAKWGRAANGFAKGYKLFARVAGGLGDELADRADEPERVADRDRPADRRRRGRLSAGRCVV